MKKLILLFVALAPAWANTLNPQTIYEVDNAGQTNHPFSYGVTFKQGDIPSGDCPQPATGGTVQGDGTVSGASLIATYQFDVKNTWPDGSVQWGIVSFYKTLTALSATLVSFNPTSGACPTSGALTRTQMENFDSAHSGWGAQLLITANGTTVTTDAQTMLADVALGFGTYCQIQTWLSGPVVTAIRVQDCTTAYKYDFGWAYNNTVPPAMGTACPPGNAGNTCSLHPIWDLYFYPGLSYNTGTNSCNAGDPFCGVKVTITLENDWTQRAQNQLYTVNLKVGTSTPSSVWTRGSGASTGRAVTDAVVTNGSTTITSATAAFVAGDVGMPVEYPAGGTGNWGVIKSVTNGTTAVLDRTPQGSASAIELQIGVHPIFSRWHKTVWTVTAPGQTRMDFNFDYLRKTKAILYYDTNVTLPDPDVSMDPTVVTTYTQWATGDKGDANGTSNRVLQFNNNDEYSPLSWYDLVYLRNMNNDCATADAGATHSKCARAWQMLTGLSGAIDTNLTANNVTGGGGVWASTGSVPIHARESRAAAPFYCVGYDDKNATPATACGSTYATYPENGRVLSRDAHPSATLNTGWESNRVYPVALVGVDNKTATYGAWDNASDGFPSHWQEYAYVAYMLTGEQFYLDELYFEASGLLVNDKEAGTTPSYASNGFFTFFNYTSTHNAFRAYAASMNTLGHAAFMAPNGTPEKLYFTAKVNSNLELLEGFLGKTGSPLTPTSPGPNPGCSSYTVSLATRWDWANCTVRSNCSLNNGTNCANTVAVSPLNYPVTGDCTSSSVIIDTTKSKVTNGEWQVWPGGVVLHHLLEMGFSNAATDATALDTRLVGEVMNANYNPYLIASLVSPYRNSTSCASDLSTGPFATDWGTVLGEFLSTLQAIASFDDAGSGHNASLTSLQWGNFRCADHGYSNSARAHGTFVGAISYAQAGCPAGTCSGASAQTWLLNNVPYYNHTVVNGQSNNCSTSAKQSKFALAVRPAGATCSISGPASPLPDGTVNLAYPLSGSVTVTTSGCTTPSFAITSGAPAGLTLNASSGAFGGTPTQSGTFNVLVAVTDGGSGGNPTQTFAVTIAPGITITPGPTLTAAIYGQPYTLTFSAANGTAPYTWLISSGSPPNGLTLSSGGILSGTPTAAIGLGVFTFDVQATDANGAVGSTTVTLTVTNFGNGAVLRGVIKF